jgi:hypothetical protein
LRGFERRRRLDHLLKAASFLAVGAFFLALGRYARMTGKLTTRGGRIIYRDRSPRLFRFAQLLLFAFVAACAGGAVAAVFGWV